jgi:thiamine-phosphate pyrophosphorylase
MGKEEAVSGVVCYVTDRRSLGEADPVRALLEKMRGAAAAGADWIQIREKDLSGAEALDLARQAAAMDGVRVIVNDRVDVAIAAGAAGVHLGHESMRAEDVVRWCRAGNAPRGFVTGVSCHGLEDVRAAASAGADYVIFGPVFDTPSKRSFGSPQGLKALGEICRGAQIPVIAIGGVNEENAGQCARAGAAGIAAIRLFQERSDPEALSDAVRRIHSEMRSARAAES